MAEKAIMLDGIIGDETLKQIQFELVGSLPRKGKEGTIYICDNTEYIFVENAWNEIGKVEPYYTSAETLVIQNQEEKPPTNCKNCGAVLKGHVCEYCGSIY